MKANLHNHSYYSDGSETPETVVELASETGIELLSLTDHNTMEGYERFERACNKAAIRFIRGVEIDAVQPEINYYSELLAYFPDGGEKEIQTLLKRKQAIRKEKVVRAVERAASEFSNDDLFVEEIEDMAVAEKGFVGMLSNKLLYRYLVSKGIKLPEYRLFQATDVWRRIWSMKNIPDNDSLFETIRYVTAIGGFAVLPHFGVYCKRSPERMDENEQEYLKILFRLKELGLWGMEIHPYQGLCQADQINARVRKWAEIVGLQLTYGSDFHGKFSSHAPFDSMSGEFKGFIR